MPGVKSNTGIEPLSTIACINACTWKRSSKSSSSSPYSTSKFSSPLQRIVIGNLRLAHFMEKPRIFRCNLLHSAAGSCTCYQLLEIPLADRTQIAFLQIAQASASGSVSKWNRIVSPGCSWPIFQNSAEAVVTGHTKSAKTRTIRTKQNRHIASQIQRTDRISIIMNIGWMKPRFPAIFTRPIAEQALSNEPPSASS